MGWSPINYLMPIAALGSGVLSYIGQSDANKKNLQAVQETNELNYQMWQENQDFTREMFQRQLDYQDPSNLRRLLENAGYNPAALVAGANGLLGSSPSAGSPSPIPAQAGHVENELGQASQLAVQGIGVAADAINKLEEAKGKSIDNLNKQQQWDLLLDNLEKSGFLTKEQAEKYAWDNLITEHAFDALSKTAQKNLYKLDAEGRLADAQARAQEWLIARKLPKEVEEIQARISNLAAQGRYYDAMEYATRAGLPSQIAASLAAAYRDNTQGALNEAESQMTEPYKEMIGNLSKSNDIGSTLMKLLIMYLREGR